jgi:hypothetical protein
MGAVKGDASMTRQFKARKSDGTEVVVYVIDGRVQDVTPLSERHTRHTMETGPPSLRTPTGQPITRLAKGRYRIVPTDEIIESNDPDAL